MHAGGYEGLALYFVLPLIGLLAGIIYIFFIALNKEYSFRGWKGGLFLFCVIIFALLSALAISNFTWDVLLIRDEPRNIMISVAIVYPLAFLLSRKIFSNNSKVSIDSLNKGLLILAILFIVLLIVWYLAES